MSDLAATLASMNDQALALRLKTAGQHVLELCEAKLLGEQPGSMLATAHALADVVGEIEALLIQMAKPDGAAVAPGGYVALGDLVEIEPHSAADKFANVSMGEKANARVDAAEALGAA
jgi:hypothetical protein